MLEGGLESGGAGTELVVLLGWLGRSGSPHPRGRGGEAGQEAQVAQDDSLAQQGGGVGGLHHLLRLGLLALNLQHKHQPSDSQSQSDKPFYS